MMIKPEEFQIQGTTYLTAKINAGKNEDYFKRGAIKARKACFYFCNYLYLLNGLVQLLFVCIFLLETNCFKKK